MKQLSSQFAFLCAPMVRLLFLLASRMHSVQLTSNSSWKKTTKHMKYPVTWTEDIFAGWAWGEKWVQLHILLIIHDLGLKRMCIHFSLIHFIKFRTKPRSSFILGGMTSSFPQRTSQRNYSSESLSSSHIPEMQEGSWHSLQPSSHMCVCSLSLSLSDCDNKPISEDYVYL